LVLSIGMAERSISRITVGTLQSFDWETQQDEGCAHTEFGKDKITAEFIGKV